MGVGMGQPIHEVPDQVRRQLKVLSANFGLYGDLSGRVASILRELFSRSRFTALMNRSCPSKASRRSNTSVSLPRLGHAFFSGPAFRVASALGQPTGLSHEPSRVFPGVHDEAGPTRPGALMDSPRSRSDLPLA